MKVILIENNEDRPTPSIWAEAINQFFTLRGNRCVYIRPGITTEDETRELLDSVMNSAGIVIAETHGGAMPTHALIPDYTITIRPNTSWHMDIARDALRTQLETCLNSVNQIDNERIIIDCLKVALGAWSSEAQERLGDALVALGWTSHLKPEGKIEWQRKNTMPLQVREEA